MKQFIARILLGVLVLSGTVQASSWMPSREGAAAGGISAAGMAALYFWLGRKSASLKKQEPTERNRAVISRLEKIRKIILYGGWLVPLGIGAGTQWAMKRYRGHSTPQPEAGSATRRPLSRQASRPGVTETPEEITVSGSLSDGTLEIKGVVPGSKAGGFLEAFGVINNQFRALRHAQRDMNEHMHEETIQKIMQGEEVDKEHSSLEYKVDTYAERIYDLFSATTVLFRRALEYLTQDEVGALKADLTALVHKYFDLSSAVLRAQSEEEPADEINAALLIENLIEKGNVDNRTVRKNRRYLGFAFFKDREAFLPELVSFYNKALGMLAKKVNARRA